MAAVDQLAAENVKLKDQIVELRRQLAGAATASAPVSETGEKRYTLSELQAIIESHEAKEGVTRPSVPATPVEPEPVAIDPAPQPQPAPSPNSPATPSGFGS